MVFHAFNHPTPGSRAEGPITYASPYYKTTCGCGVGNQQVTQTSQGLREGFSTREGFQGEMPQGQGQAQAQWQPPMPQFQGGGGGGGAPMCTLTATAPPAGCCHPAPLHCDCCNGSGYFRASEAYGS